MILLLPSGSTGCAHPWIHVCVSKSWFYINKNKNLMDCRKVMTKLMKNGKVAETPMITRCSNESNLKNGDQLKTIPFTNIFLLADRKDTLTADASRWPQIELTSFMDRYDGLQEMLSLDELLQQWHTRINTETIMESTCRCKYPSALFFITEASKSRWTRIDMLCIIINIGQASYRCVSP